MNRVLRLLIAIVLAESIALTAITPQGRTGFRLKEITTEFECEGIKGAVFEITPNVPTESGPQMVTFSSVKIDGSGIPSAGDTDATLFRGSPTKRVIIIIEDR